MHIPKNGGKTLNSILNCFYPQEKSFAINEITPNKSNLEYFYDLPEEQKAKFEILRGHMNFGLHKYLSSEAKYFTLLRRPEERIISFYYFVLRQPNHRLYQQVQSLSLVDFVQNLNPPDLNNGQIRFISGISDKEEFMLEKALENIEKHFAFVGTLEKFDESLLFLKRVFGWPDPFYTIKNKSPERKKVEELPLNTQRIIAEYNEGDLLLYKEITARIEEKIRKSPTFNIEVNIFRLFNEIYSLPVGKRLIKKAYLNKSIQNFQ